MNLGNIFKTIYCFSFKHHNFQRNKSKVWKFRWNSFGLASNSKIVRGFLSERNDFQSNRILLDYKTYIVYVCLVEKLICLFSKTFNKLIIILSSPSLVLWSYVPCFMEIPPLFYVSLLDNFYNIMSLVLIAFCDKINSPITGVFKLSAY